VNAQKVARVLAVAAVLAVAVVAGIASFSHIEALALAHGYTITTARLLPVSVDGLIVASSMALLTETRARNPQPGLARAGLVLGILATLAANVVAGLAFGPVGAVINAWPAVAFIIASEILLKMIRPQGITEEATLEPMAWELESVPVPPASGTETVPDDVPADVPAEAVPPVPEPVVRPVPARTARRTSPGRAKPPGKVFAAELAAGQVPSVRQIKERLHVGTDNARVIRDELEELVQEKAA
jgi:hypothetical protein